MSINNQSQVNSHFSAKNIPNKNVSGYHMTHSNSSYTNTNSNSDFMSRLTSNSPSKSMLHGLATSLSSQQQSPVHLAETGRRPSANTSRISFLYNNSFKNNTVNMFIGGSSDSGESGFSSSNVPNTPNVMSQQPREMNSYNNPTERTHFQASSEILACDRAWETPNLVAIATPRNLQLLKISSTEVSLETELLMKPPGRTKIGTISDLAFGHQQYGRYLAASTITGSVHIYNLDRGTRMKTTLSGHQRAVNSISFNTISPHLLASGSQDGKILIWDLKASSSKPSMTLNCNADAVRCNSFSPKKANVLAAVFDSGVVEKWDLRKNNTWEKRMNAHTGPALSVHWHPELDYVVTGGRDKQLQVWNLGSGLESREPCHVINTSGPISKAKWCKGRGNGSIMNTDIAVSFFNDDSCVQIWNLNRKYIPKCVIDGHSAPITQIIWRTPKNLISCSKDKTLIQYDVTKEPNFIDNFSAGSFTWNPRDKFDLLFVKQKKSQFEGSITPSTPPIGANSNPNINAISRHPQSSDLNTVEEVDIINNNISTSGINSTSSIQNSMMASESGMQLYEMSNTSPGGHSPTLVSSLKLQRQHLPPRQPSFIKPTAKSNIPPPAWLMPVHLPLLSNNIEKFKFLSTHYMIKVPDGSDITDVCEYNSMLAASVGYFRDCQTWKTIQMAIILKIETANDEEIESKLKNFAFEKIDSFSQTDSHLGTSYGSESDITGRKSIETSGSLTHRDHTMKERKNIEDMEIDENAIIDDEDEENSSLNMENNNKVEVISNLHKDNGSTSSLNVASTNNKNDIITLLKDDKIKVKRSSSASVSTTQMRPIEIDSRSKQLRGSMNRPFRYSFTGSSVDMDDEKKSGSPLSLSCSPMIHKSRSRMMLMAMNKNNSDDLSLNIGKSVETKFSRTSDNKSQLTAILKDNNNINGNLTMTSANDRTNKENIDINGYRENSQTNHGNNHKNGLKVPWNPEDLIKQAAQYSSEQGDILMSATLSLLFATLYPNSITSSKAEEWIFYYHEYLLRCGYFVNAATVLRIASENYDSFKKIGQTTTSVRTLCCHCGKPILNDESKESHNKKIKRINNIIDSDKTINNNFGFWYCDRCRKLQGGCNYCGEPIKGNAVALIGCGHEGHFGCFRTWFIDQGERECPSCGILCVK